MNFTLSLDVTELLDRQSNKSGTVEEALRLYFKNKDTVKRLVSLADRLDRKLPEPAQTNEKVPSVREQVEAFGLIYDARNSQAFSQNDNRYLPIKVSNGIVEILGEWS